MADIEANPKLPDSRRVQDGQKGDENENAKSEDEKTSRLPHSPSGSKAEKVTTGVKDEKKKPSKLKELWGNLGLDLGTVLMMFK